jgi:hypothetical protein
VFKKYNNNEKTFRKLVWSCLQVKSSIYAHWLKLLKRATFYLLEPYIASNITMYAPKSGFYPLPQAAQSLKISRYK